jgi:endonuclease/exonuclease/phosphatase family metal-dependent hydrolase
VELTVRTWNLFHGRTSPETGRHHLERMVRLVSTGRPSIVCLQEVPLWALPSLAAWSRMQARWTVTKRAFGGPVAETLQRANARIARSGVTGQANVLLLAPDLRVAAFAVQRLNPGVRGERRTCQLARLRLPGGELLAANLHATNRAGTARRELEIVERLVGGSRPAIVAGDYNVRQTGLQGFSPAIAGIDQIVVRGLELLRAPAPWPDERRRIEGGVLLSDHSPIEAEMISR